MRYSENTDRQRVLKQALCASTLAEIETASQELRMWTSAHPDDIGIVDAFEQLDLLRRAAKDAETGSTDALIRALL
jgi:hypothetical protein